jgi:hypothetical protein
VIPVIAGEPERGPLSDHPALAGPRVTVRDEHVAEEDLTQLFTSTTAVLLPLPPGQPEWGWLRGQVLRAPLIVTDIGGCPNSWPTARGSW